LQPLPRKDGQHEELAAQERSASGNSAGRSRLSRLLFTALEIVLMIGFVVALLSLVFSVVGCATKNAKGGKSGFSSSGSGHTNTFNIEQPENPSSTATQSFETEVTQTTIVPAGTVTEEVVTNVVPGIDAGTPPQTNVTVRRTFAPEPTTNTTRRFTRAGASIGPSHEDKSKELKAAFDAMKPVQWVGIACVLIAGAFLYFKWFTPALISGGVGLLFIFAAQILPGNTWIGFLLFGALAIALVFRAYEKGQLDSLLPDALDRNRKEKS
jgi:hypothetical protein